jgi:hypothetical protein
MFRFLFRIFYLINIILDKCLLLPFSCLLNLMSCLHYVNLKSSTLGLPGRAMAQAVSRQLITTDACVHAQVSPCGICGGHGGTGIGFSQSFLSVVSVIPSWLSVLMYHLEMNSRLASGHSSRNIVSPHQSRLYGVMVSVLATGLRGRRFKPARGSGFLRVIKNP